MQNEPIDLNAVRTARLEAAKREEREAGALRFSMSVVDYGDGEFDLTIHGCGTGDEEDYPWRELSMAAARCMCEIAFAGQAKRPEQQDLPVGVCTMFGDGRVSAWINRNLTDSVERKNWFLRTAELCVQAVRNALS